MTENQSIINKKKVRANKPISITHRNQTTTRRSHNRNHSTNASITTHKDKQQTGQRVPLSQASGTTKKPVGIPFTETEKRTKEMQ